MKWSKLNVENRKSRILSECNMMLWNLIVCIICSTLTHTLSVKVLPALYSFIELFLSLIYEFVRLVYPYNVAPYYFYMQFNEYKLCRLMNKICWKSTHTIDELWLFANCFKFCQSIKKGSWLFLDRDLAWLTNFARVLDRTLKNTLNI